MTRDDLIDLLRENLTANELITEFIARESTDGLEEIAFLYNLIDLDDDEEEEEDDEEEEEAEDDDVQYVIHSRTESSREGEGVYWSNEMGWVTPISEATVFTPAERYWGTDLPVVGPLDVVEWRIKGDHE